MNRKMHDYFSQKKLKLTSTDTSVSNIEELLNAGSMNSMNLRKMYKKPAHINQKSYDYNGKFPAEKSRIKDKCHVRHFPACNPSSSKTKGPILKARDNFDEFYKSIAPSSVKKPKIIMYEESVDSSFSKKTDDLFSQTLKIPVESENQKLSEIFDIKDIKLLNQILKEKSLADEDSNYTNQLKNLAIRILNNVNELEQQNEQ